MTDGSRQKKKREKKRHDSIKNNSQLALQLWKDIINLCYNL